MRIFNTYGPRMHPNDGRVVSNFIIQALLGRARHHQSAQAALMGAANTSQGLVHTIAYFEDLLKEEPRHGFATVIEMPAI
jgi:nucleoside-diphosphate-sugar epimerase